jgi:hypothetical protein
MLLHLSATIAFQTHYVKESWADPVGKQNYHPLETPSDIQLTTFIDFDAIDRFRLSQGGYYVSQTLDRPR